MISSQQVSFVFWTNHKMKANESDKVDKYLDFPIEKVEYESSSDNWIPLLQSRKRKKNRKNGEKLKLKKELRKSRCIAAEIS